MTQEQMIERLSLWAMIIREQMNFDFPDIDLDTLQYDLDAIASAIAGE
jgi:hypothetical protein